MGKIYTDLSLPEVVKYSGDERGYPLVGHKHLPNLRCPFHMVEFARPPDGGVWKILPVAISDINKGRFDGYADGYIQLVPDDQKMAEIKSMEDQERLVADNRGFFTHRLGFLRLWDSPRGLSGLRDAWACFYFNNHPEYGNPALVIQKTAPESKDSQKVRGIVLPFVDERQLDAVVQEIMRD